MRRRYVFLVFATMMLSIAGCIAIFGTPQAAVSQTNLIDTDHENRSMLALTVDTTPPTTRLLSDGTLGSGGWYVSEMSVALFATDEGTGVASTHYRINDGPWTEYEGSFILNIDGNNSIEYYSIDSVGNGEDVKMTYVPIDTLSPDSVAILTGIEGNDGWYRSDVTVELSATDSMPGSGVEEIQYSLDGTSWTTFSQPFTISNEGRALLWYRSFDVAGNYEENHSTEILIDKTDPDTIVRYEGSVGYNGWYTSEVLVAMFASDYQPGSGVATIYYQIDDGAWEEYAGVFSITEDGNHTLRFYSNDTALNMEAVNIKYVSIDMTAPKTITSVDGTLGNDGWYVSDLYLSLHSTDHDSGSGAEVTYYNLNEGGWKEYTGVIFLDSDGNHTIEYYSVDFAGNTESVKSESLMIDSTPPLSSSALEGELGSDGCFTSDVTVILSASDQYSGVSRIEYSSDSIEWLSYSEPLIYTGSGSTTIYYRAVDIAGNTEQVDSVDFCISPATLEADIEIIPSFLNLDSRARWLFVLITLPEGYDLREVDISSIEIRYADESVNADWGIILFRGRLLLVKFDRAAIVQMIRNSGGDGKIQLEVWGKVSGMTFVGSDTVRVWSWRQFVHSMHQTRHRRGRRHKRSR